jgi:hypothetical protein
MPRITVKSEFQALIAPSSWRRGRELLGECPVRRWSLEGIRRTQGALGALSPYAGSRCHDSVSISRGTDAILSLYISKIGSQRIEGACRRRRAWLTGNLGRCRRLVAVARRRAPFRRGGPSRTAGVVDGWMGYQAEAEGNVMLPGPMTTFLNKMGQAQGRPTGKRTGAVQLSAMLKCNTSLQYGTLMDRPIQARNPETGDAIFTPGRAIICAI